MWKWSKWLIAILVLRRNLEPPQDPNLQIYTMNCRKIYIYKLQMKNITNHEFHYVYLKCFVFKAILQYYSKCHVCSVILNFSPAVSSTVCLGLFYSFFCFLFCFFNLPRCWDALLDDVCLTCLFLSFWYGAPAQLNTWLPLHSISNSSG